MTLFCDLLTVSKRNKFRIIIQTINFVPTVDELIMTSEENPAVALFKSSHDEMREVIKQNSNVQITSNVSSDGVTSEEEDPAVTKFREYIRIETVQPNPDNEGAMKFLARY